MCCCACVQIIVLRLTSQRQSTGKTARVRASTTLESLRPEICKWLQVPDDAYLEFLCYGRLDGTAPLTSHDLRLDADGAADIFVVYQPARPPG